MTSLRVNQLDNQYTKFKFGTVTCCVHIISCQNVPMCVNIVSLLSQCGVHIVSLVIISCQNVPMCDNIVSLLCIFSVSVVSIVVSIWSIVFILCQYCPLFLFCVNMVPIAQVSTWSLID